jgi:4-amino-4-deoxy-L-arabinose transferase-like glycosyltransferase
VTTSTYIAPRKNANELFARIGWAALICATLYVCYFSHLGAIGFVGPDEPRYAWIARDMAETGDWVTPRLYGKPWFEKPPLYYWGAAICFKLFGVTEAAARLPSAISALLATLAIAWLGWRIYGAETPRWLLLLLPTTVGMIGFSHAAATDMPFSAMLTTAMVCAAILLRLPLECGGLPPLSPNQASATDSAGTPATAPNSSSFTPSTSLTSLLFGFFLGLAVLAKGPAAIILCGGAVFFWALFTKRWRDALRLLHPAAIAAFCLTALPWYILCARRNPDFIRIFIIEHNFKRYLTPEFQHIQPFWFYVPILLAGLLPWTLFVIPVVKAARESFHDYSYSVGTIFCASWSLFPLIFFTVSKSKLPGYILPSIPPLILLCADGGKRLSATNSRFARVVVCGTTLTAIGLVGAAIRYALSLKRLVPFPPLVYDSSLSLRLVYFAGFLFALSAPFFVFRRRSRTGVLCTVAGLVAVLWSTPLTIFDSALSPRQASKGILKMGGQNSDVLLCGVARSARYGFNFYLRRELADWEQRDPEKRSVVVQGRPSCLSQIIDADYTPKGEMDFPRWTLFDVEPR